MRPLPRSTGPGRLSQRIFDKTLPPSTITALSKLEAIEADIRALPRNEAEALQDWLSDYLDFKGV